MGNVFLKCPRCQEQRMPLGKLSENRSMMLLSNPPVRAVEYACSNRHRFEIWYDSWFPWVYSIH